MRCSTEDNQGGRSRKRVRERYRPKAGEGERELEKGREGESEVENNGIHQTVLDQTVFMGT